MKKRAGITRSARCCSEFWKLVLKAAGPLAPPSRRSAGERKRSNGLPRDLTCPQRRVGTLVAMSDMELRGADIGTDLSNSFFWSCAAKRGDQSCETR